MHHPGRDLVRWTLLLAGALGASAMLEAASLVRQLDAIFQPPRVEQAALARDGRHVAFALRDDRSGEITIRPTRASVPAARARVEVPAGIPVRSLEWIAPDRLVAAWGDAAVIVLDDAGRVVARWEGAKAFTVGEQKRSGRPVVRVLGATEAPDTVLLEVNWVAATATLDLLRVNVRTLERHLQSTIKLDAPGGSVWVDRQGRPRVLLARGELPWRFRVLTGAEKPGDGPMLDRVLNPSLPASALQVTPRNFAGERAFPLGFEGDPGVVYLASNVGRDTFAIHTYDLTTGERGGLTLEDAAVDLADFAASPGVSPLVFDRERGTLAGVRIHGLTTSTTRWLDAELGRVQAQLDEKFPDRGVEIREWDDARERFLVRVAALHESGRHFVYHRTDGRCIEYQRDGSLAAGDANRVEAFVFAVEGGGKQTGYLTLPSSSPSPLPLLVWLHDGPLKRVRPEFQRDAQVLAALGFAVAQINYRGSAGLGRRHREELREGFDRGPVEDVVSAVTALRARADVDGRRIAVGGEGFGGYLALRTLQMHPEVFRSAVAINALIDLAPLARSGPDPEVGRRRAEASILTATTAPRSFPMGENAEENGGAAPAEPEVVLPSLPAGPPERSRAADFDSEFARWFFGPAGRQRGSVLAHVEHLTRPVLLAHEPRHPAAALAPVRRLREALVRRKQAVEFLELPPRFAEGGAEVRVPAFRRIAEFLEAKLSMSASEVTP